MLKLGNTLFLPIRGNRRPITGGCECPFCEAHPGRPPQWDTFSIDPKTGYYGEVHFPEFAEAIQ
jgi:hypothetical protein